MNELTNIHKSSVVLDALHRAALGLLLLVLLLHLRSLTTDLSGTRQRSVHLTCDQKDHAQRQVGCKAVNHDMGMGQRLHR